MCCVHEGVCMCVHTCVCTCVHLCMVKGVRQLPETDWQGWEVGNFRKMSGRKKQDSSELYVVKAGIREQWFCFKCFPNFWTSLGLEPLPRFPSTFPLGVTQPESTAPGVAVVAGDRTEMQRQPSPCSGGQKHRFLNLILNMIRTDGLEGVQILHARNGQRVQLYYFLLNLYFSYWSVSNTWNFYSLVLVFSEMDPSLFFFRTFLFD